MYELPSYPPFALYKILLRLYVGLATKLKALLVHLKCMRGPADEEDEEEDGAGDRHGDQPQGRALVPVHNCGASCIQCPHRSASVSLIFIVL